MMDSIDRPATLRLAMNSDNYTLLREARQERLAALEAQKEIALGTDRQF